MKKIVVIGGGHGSSVILRGLKQISNVKLTAVVTVADDGGSTGRLRALYRAPAVGDIRNVMVALAESESLLGTLMDFRFDGEEDVGGHNLGNLMLMALTQSCGNFIEAIQKLSKVLKVKGSIVPSTTQVVTLLAMMEDGTLVRGESNIPKFKNHIQKVFYQEEVHATKQSIRAIVEADYIIYSCGSLYTSVLPNLIIPEIRAAIKRSKAKKINCCNVMTQPGETDHYNVEDHVQAILQHSENENAVDVVIMRSDELYEKTLQRYLEQDATPVLVEKKEHSYKIMPREILSFEGGLIRHDSIKLKTVFEEILNEE